MIWDIAGTLLIIILAVIIYGAGYLVGKHSNNSESS